MSGTTGHLTCALFGSKAARQLKLPWRAAELASGSSSGGSPKFGAGNARFGRRMGPPKVLRTMRFGLVRHLLE